MNLLIGTAAWNIPSQLKPFFPAEGSHLERYSRIFNAVEINSSFYRDHKRSVFEKWAKSTPADFKFSVKLFKYFSHEAVLTDTGPMLHQVLDDISGLEEKWGALLIQTPPSLAFNRKDAKKFFAAISKRCPAPIVFEPRHQSWVSADALELLAEYSVNKVLADPEPCRTPVNRRPSVESTRYYRLHGSPQLYKSLYSKEFLEKLHSRLKAPLSYSKNTWVIFDNSMFGHATMNALSLLKLNEKKISPENVKLKDAHA